MTLYAQTNLELFKQLESNGYCQQDLLLIQKAYQLAMIKLSGMYRPSGKTSMAHFIGTASILASLKVPITLVAAGLLHAIYRHGDFGTLTKGVSDSKRQKVRNIVGEEVEEYIYRYLNTKPDLDTLNTFNQQLHKLDTIDRNTWLIRLVNELEDCLDGGILYCHYAKQRKKNYQQSMPLMIEIAEKLGFSNLALELHKVLNEINAAKIPKQKLRCQKTYGDFQVIPESYYKKIHIKLYEEIINLFNIFQSLMSRLKNKMSRLSYLKKV
ncbi:MAG: DUF6817 domain-containing protein [Cyanobacteria bacterium P01_H01_bin.35]